RTKRIEETKLKVKLFLAKESADLSEISQKLYQVYFDKKSLARAMKDAKRNTRFGTQENLDAKDTACAINEYLKKYKIDKWNVRITDKVDFYFQVRPKRKLITISSSINWDYVGLDSALAHEVDGHVIRAINAHAQKRYFRENFPFYIKTEEGLSCYLSDYLSDGGELTRAHHAIKYLGGLFALAHSFRKTYEFFLNYGFTPDLAFQRTFRLKRGYTDTSQPGCFAREAMYYEGMLEVKDYLEGGGDIRKLYAGKVGLRDLDLVPIPENQVIPKRTEIYLS
ncbi:MAG: tyrosine/phenylalanine carboxypeptidase domain-containing protein, partial [Patescibacteria group bacterium]